MLAPEDLLAAAPASIFLFFLSGGGRTESWTGSCRVLELSMGVSRLPSDHLVFSFSFLSWMVHGSSGTAFNFPLMS